MLPSILWPLYIAVHADGSPQGSVLATEVQWKHKAEAMYLHVAPVVDGTSS